MEKDSLYLYSAWHNGAQISYWDMHRYHHTNMFMHIEILKDSVNLQFLEYCLKHKLWISRISLLTVSQILVIRIIHASTISDVPSSLGNHL